MTVKKTLKTLYITFALLVLICGYQLTKTQHPRVEKFDTMGQETNLPTSLYMHNLIETYAEKHNIPKYILFNVAYLETGYRGPFHVNYNPSQRSFAGAVGPMQIITKYSHSYAGRRVKESELRNNLRLNVDISCKMLEKLYKMYGRWDIALGYYNTGYPQVNDYARYAAFTKDYEKQWVKPKMFPSI